MTRTDGPTALALSRQNLPAVTLGHGGIANIARGGYVLRNARDPQIVLLATGSEVGLAVDAAVALERAGVSARVVSMPCTALFDAQVAGDKFRVVFDGGDHSVFNGGDLREAQWLNRVTGENHESTSAATAQVIREKTAVLTLKFLDAYVKTDPKASDWLRDEAKSAVGATGEWSAR